jgi:acyl-CoA thioester hydrolase
MTNTINTYRGTIYPWNCDHMGHMNVQFYVGKFDEASWNLLSSVGLSPAYLKENNSGMVALEQHINYYKEVFAGDSIYIESEIIEIREKTMLLKHVMFNQESKDIISQTEITGLHIDTKLRKAIPLPLFVKEKIYGLRKEIMKAC